MLYKDNWEQTQQKFKEFWARENHDRPLVAIEGVKKEGYSQSQVKTPSNVRDIWLDTGYIIKCARERFASTYFAGESYPLLWPNLGPDILSAILGCRLNFKEDTTWVDHDFDSWDSLDKIAWNPESVWWVKLKEMTEEMVKDARGDYFVGITDLHPGADALSALRGPENLCIDLIECPETVKRTTFEIFEIFKRIVDESYSMTSVNLPGSSNYASIWHPGKYYSICNDFSCMISNEMYKEFFLNELVEEMRYLDATIYHLDGPDALRHLDTLLSIPELGGIQWIPGEGNPQGAYWIPMLQKIQKAGKVIQHFIKAEEMDIHLENLEPEGIIYYIYDCRSEQDARDIMKKAERSYKRKIY